MITLGPVIRSIFLLPVSNLHPSKHETVLKDNCITSDVPGKMQTKSSNSFNVLEELRGGWKGRGGGITFLFVIALFRVLE